jgi:methyltransferase (TIGR00027 family)
MQVEPVAAPDTSAVRVALWRAIHVQVDSAPPVLDDELGLALAAPAQGWRERPDMNPDFTRGFRASIVARSRYIEDLVAERAQLGLRQYVILGAGLDTFAQRRPEIASELTMFEIDKPATQAWKRARLIELGYGIPEWLRFVPVNFEAGESWLQKLNASGFAMNQPAVISSLGVSMYISKDANMGTLRQLATLAEGSTLVMSFLLPRELVAPEDRAGLDISERGARASGTPFVSFYAPEELLAMAREAGFRQAKHVSSEDQTRRYFAGRNDGLRPSTGEDLLVATT